LITQLDSRKFKIREAAERELQAFGEQILAALRAAYKDSPSVEAQRRLSQILKKLESPDGGTLRRIRAVAILRHFVGSKSARQTLESLARGAPGTWLTQEAKAVLASYSE